MRAPAVSFAKRFTAAALAALLTFTLLPAAALAEGKGETFGIEESQEANSGQADEAAEASAPEDAKSDTVVDAPLASVLAGAPTAFVNADVALDSEPVIGSFTVDGLTFAVVDDSTVELVGVSEAAGASPRRVVASSQGLSAPLALPDLGSTPTASETEADDSVLALPESVAYEGVEYSVTSIGAYAFYLSGVTSVELPASVVDVDDRAFRSSDVASVEVADGNPHYSSFDGALYSADQLSLLLIPEGKQGTVLLPSTAESAAPSVFSHCPLVTQISVEEGSAAFASENGLLYDASLTTLLRVPAGATEITIHDGCTTIAVGVLEACASLSIINAPASVTSISPDVFTSVPTISLPAAALVEDAPQLTALVALNSTDDDLPEIDPAGITVTLPPEGMPALWEERGCLAVAAQFQESASDSDSQSDLPIAKADNFLTSRAITYYTVTVYPNGHTLNAADKVWSTSGQYLHATLRTYTISGSQIISDAWTRSFHTAFDHVNLEFWDRYYGSNTDLWQFTEITNGTVGWSLRGFARTPNGAALNAGSGNVWFEESTSLFALWRAHTYEVRYNANGGTGTMGNSSHVYDTGQSLTANAFWRPGYTFAGWGTSAWGPVAYGNGAWVTNLTAADGGVVDLYAQWTANPITLTWNSNGGSAVASTTQTYSPTAKVALPANPTKAGHTFAGWWTAPTGGVQVTSSTALPTANATYHAHWSLNPYEISYELNGGTVSGNPTTYDVTTTTFTLKNPTRTGYVFAGWSGTGLTGDANMTVTISQGSTGDRSYTAHWLPAISADIPLEVTAQVDLLDIEEQQEATGYIESRCGEPLGVAAIELSPLSGASELFGTGNVADVALEVLVAGSISPDARFALDASASQAPATPAAFRMASYGTRVPISYRFDIPETLLSSLVETTKPVCSVAYTVALA